MKPTEYHFECGCVHTEPYYHQFKLYNGRTYYQRLMTCPDHVGSRLTKKVIHCIICGNPREQKPSSSNAQFCLECADRRKKETKSQRHLRMKSERKINPHPPKIIPVPEPPDPTKNPCRQNPECRNRDKLLDPQCWECPWRIAYAERIEDGQAAVYTSRSGYEMFV